MLPGLRQGGAKLQEEGDFAAALTAWSAPLAGTPPLVERVADAAIDAQYGTDDYFSQVLSLYSGFMLSDSGRFGRFVARLAALSEKSPGGKPDFGGLMMAAADAGRFQAFRCLAELQDRVSPPQAKGAPIPEKDFGGVLLSGDGMLATSSTSGWDKPSLRLRAIDAVPIEGNGFHTEREKEPKAVVTLPGECLVRGIVAIDGSMEPYHARQVPIEFLVSADGGTWKEVFSCGEPHGEYRADLSSAPVRCRQVTVRRKPGAKDEYFHLTKILVYGERLY